MENLNSKFKLGNEVLANYEDAEAANVDKFIELQVKEAQKDIKDCKTRLSVNKVKFENEVDTYDADIEDATNAVQDAYKTIDITKITTNADRKSYSYKYQAAISDANVKLERLTFNKEDAELMYKDGVKALKARIKRNEEVVAIFSVVAE